VNALRKDACVAELLPDAEAPRFIARDKRHPVDRLSSKQVALSAALATDQTCNG